MTIPDPLLDRLRRLRRPAPDDITAARTLARAEAAFAAARRRPRAALSRWSVPAALALWGVVYAWGAVRELGRLFPTEVKAQPAVAVDHRGPARVDSGAQFMLNAISNASARTTATMTMTPLFPDTLRATSRSNAVPFCSDVFSEDMDLSLKGVACDTGIAERVTFGAGRGTIAARTAARSEHGQRRRRGPAPAGRVSRPHEG